MSKNIVKGYKVFNPDWTCSPNGHMKQYTCPGMFEEDVELKICRRGMHFCESLVDCFDYHDFDPKNHVAEVIAYGNIKKDSFKCCTNKLEIVRELTWEEVLRLVNIGKNCSGLKNCGDFNAGNCNCGDYNSGDWNSGDHNSGYWNSGNHNDGNRNNGHYNSGNWNSGNCNSGNDNSGNHNTGNQNSGDWNSGDYTSGCFNTVCQPIFLFNKVSNWTMDDWKKSKTKKIMKDCPPEKEDRQDWWDNLDNYDKNMVKALPNFDPKIFKEITGIDVD